MAEEGFYGRKLSSWMEFERNLADYSKDTYQVFATLDSRTVSKQNIRLSANTIKYKDELK